MKKRGRKKKQVKQALVTNISPSTEQDGPVLDLEKSIIKKLINQNTPVVLPYLTPDEFDQFATINKNNNKSIEKDQNSRSIIKALINALFGN